MLNGAGARLGATRGSLRVVLLVATAALVALLVVAVAPPVGEAGTYSVRECYHGESSPANTFSDGRKEWASPHDSNFTYVWSGTDCVNETFYVGVNDHGWLGWASYDDFARWVVDAPSGTSFSSFSASVYSVVYNGHQTGVFSRAGGSYHTQFHHYTPGTSAGGAHAWNVSGADQVLWQVWCGEFGCSQSSATGIYLNYMTFVLNDSSPPSVGGLGGTMTSGDWKKPASESISASASDLGSGLRSAALEVNGSERHPQTYGCSIMPSGYAGHLRPCSRSEGYSTTFNTGTAPFQTGINTVRICVRDYADSSTSSNRTCQSGQAKVDGAAPSQTIAGSGWSPQNGTVVADTEYMVNVDARDGTQGGANLQRQSGVDRVELRIWSAGGNRPTQPTMTTSQGGAGCGSSQDSCPLSTSFSYKPEEFVQDELEESSTATLKLEVTSVDELGNATPVGTDVKTFTVVDDVDAPTVTMTTGQPASDGSYPVTISATDPASGGTVSSGIVHLELLVDGQVVEEWDQPCSSGGCTMTRTRTLSGSQSTANHEVAAFADDRADNTGFDSRGAWADRSYQYLGYNDDFANADSFREGMPLIADSAATNLRRGIDTARQGGAEVVRLQIQGCLVAENATSSETPVPESQWRWQQLYGQFFQQVREVNQGSGPPIQVIPHLTDSPPWANKNGSEDDDPSTTDWGKCNDSVVGPPRGNAVGDGFYRDFVRGFLDEFAKDPLNGIIAVQAWNEPNNPTFWGSSEEKRDFDSRDHEEPDRFARLVNIADEEVDRFNATATVPDGPDPDTAPDPAPDVTMLPGALSPAGTPRGRYIRDVLTNAGDGSEGAPSYDPDGPTRWVNPDDITAWAAHFYSRNDDGDDEAMDRINHQAREVRRGLKKSEATALDVWVTEIGFAARPAGETKQSERLIWAYRRFARPKFKSIVVHRLLDPFGDPGGETTDQLAVIERRPQTNEWRPRLAYCHLAQTQGLTGSTAPPRCQQQVIPPLPRLIGN